MGSNSHTLSMSFEKFKLTEKTHIFILCFNTPLSSGDEWLFFYLIALVEFKLEMFGSNTILSYICWLF
jgi:hypothetical protein